MTYLWNEHSADIHLANEQLNISPKLANDSTSFAKAGRRARRSLENECHDRTSGKGIVW